MSEMVGKGFSRRQFLIWSGVTTLGAAVPWAAAARPAGAGLRLGVVGLGESGTRALGWLAKQPGIAVTALCDRRSGALSSSLDRCRGLSLDAPPEPFTSADRLLASGAVEALVVATPPDAALGLARDGCAAGLSLFLSRPCAGSAEELAELASSPERRRRHLALGRARRLAASPGVLETLARAEGTGQEERQLSIHHSLGIDEITRRETLDSLAELLLLGRGLLGGGRLVEVEVLRAPGLARAGARVTFRFEAPEGPRVLSLRLHRGDGPTWLGGTTAGSRWAVSAEPADHDDALASLRLFTQLAGEPPPADEGPIAGLILARKAREALVTAG